MKIYKFALANLALLFSSAQVLAEDPAVADTMQQVPTFQSLPNDDEVTNRYIVKFKKGSKDFETRMHQASVQHSNRKLRKSAVSPDENLLAFGSFLPKENAQVLYLNSDEEVQEWNERDDVEYVEPDSKVYLLSEEVPYGIGLVHALDVPDTDVSNRKVCIIDTGYDITHPDLPSDPSVVTGYNGSFSAGAWDHDGHGHGTHVAGTLAAIGGNDKGVVGVNRNGQLRLHIVKVFNNNGRWAWRSTLVAAVEECVDNGANIVSMSLGGSRFSQIESDAYERIYAEDDVLLIAAAGNGRGGLTSYSYPASYDSVMSVAATDSENKVTSFSQRNDQVDIAAPGLYVKSTLPFDVKPSGYGTFSGTSMSTPHVSGIAALVWSLDTSKSALEIRRILQASAEDLGEPGWDKLYGHGLVRADKARDLVLDPNYTLPPTQSPTIDYGSYCNYRGCDGEAQGGEWCNLSVTNCEGNCSGTWCKRLPPGTKSPSPPTDPPTKAPSPPTTSPTKTPTVPPTNSPTKTPTLSPSFGPTMTASASPSFGPTMQPTPCQDVPTDEFFFRMKTTVDPEKPIYKTCEWLISEKTDEQRARICAKYTDSHGGYGPARDVCKKACETCDISDEPSTVPSKSPTLAPTTSPSRTPTNTPTTSPTRSGPCCSQDFRTCPDSIPEWCSQSEGNCQQCGGTLITGAPLQCIGKWGVCTDNVDGCCSPATCEGNQYFRQCLG